MKKVKIYYNGSEVEVDPEPFAKIMQCAQNSFKPTRVLMYGARVPLPNTGDEECLYTSEEILSLMKVNK